jgi:hypothetical protein
MLNFGGVDNDPGPADQKTAHRKILHIYRLYVGKGYGTNRAVF